MSLVEETLYGVRDKPAMAIELLREFVPPEGFYLAYSGGKDSTVLLDLARRSGVKFDAHYNRTTVDPPELVRFIRSQEGIIENHPEISMWDLIIKKRMPPTRIARFCCEHLKEGGGMGRRVLTGVRAAESYRRSKRQQIESCFKDGHRQYYHPILYWSESDVWEYIRSRNLPYCSLYDEGLTRIGCICCPMGGKAKQILEGERWPKYKEQYIRSFQRMLDKRLADGLFKADWSTGQDVWDWWTRKPDEAPDSDETLPLFE
jgi:phosphoadenosine phosphosulfate reductase